jgi:hypothetical protein
MLKNKQEQSISKKIIFFVISVCISLIVITLIITGYFAYKKLSLSYDYCQSFGEINSEIGWTLKKNVKSCLTLTNRISGEVYFDTKIFTDTNGFRSSNEEKSEDGSILAIGDSWTFGYGVNYEETYPFYLSKLLDEPVYNSGVPAYGSASNYLNAKSNIEMLRPKTVIYLTLGMYRRSFCLKPWDDYISLHQKQLIPCYLIDQSTSKVKLMKPLPGIVEESVGQNIYPGGSLTAGYDSFWRYVFLTKPKLVIQDLKERIGLAPIKIASKEESYQIKKNELNSLLGLANKYNFQFVLIDPLGQYNQIILNNHVNNSQNLLYIGKDTWDMEVINKSTGLPSQDRYVPMDGHFGKGMNRLIANLVYKEILANNSDSIGLIE